MEYWGETGRDGFSRGEEHVAGCRNKLDDNPMWKHVWEHHDGVGGEELFTMRMEHSFPKPLVRQIREGVEIEMSRGTLMNSKSEWNNSRIPRIVIETGEKLEEEQESGLGRQGEKQKVNGKSQVGRPHIIERNVKRGYEGTEVESSKETELKRRRVK